MTAAPETWKDAVVERVRAANAEGRTPSKREVSPHHLWLVDQLIAEGRLERTGDGPSYALRIPEDRI